MEDGDIELRIVRILLLHEAMSSGNVSDGQYIERKQDRAKDGALWHAQDTLGSGGLGLYGCVQIDFYGRGSCETSRGRGRKYRNWCEVY